MAEVERLTEDGEEGTLFNGVNDYMYRGRPLISLITNLINDLIIFNSPTTKIKISSSAELAHCGSPAAEPDRTTMAQRPVTIFDGDLRRR